MYALDSQTSVARGGENATNIVNAPVTIADPDRLTMTEPTWGEPSPGGRVIVLGYPVGTSGAHRLHAAVGRVLDDNEARAVLEDLSGSGDVETTIDYISEVETVLEGDALPGMSGAGVFNTEGLQVAVLIRGFTSRRGVPHMRAVRMSHVVASISTAFESLTNEQRTAVRPYLDLGLSD